MQEGYHWQRITLPSQIFDHYAKATGELSKIIIPIFPLTPIYQYLSSSTCQCQYALCCWQTLPAMAAPSLLEALGYVHGPLQLLSQRPKLSYNTPSGHWIGKKNMLDEKSMHCSHYMYLCLD